MKSIRRRRRELGLTREEAVVEAGAVRLRPILLTLFVVPSAYLILNGAAERLGAWLPGSAPSRRATSAPVTASPSPGVAARVET